jgi:hypothetical protein
MAASRLMLDVRMWRRIKSKLVSKGKLHVCENGIYSPRAERELAAANAGRQATTQADVGSIGNGHDRQHEDRRDQVEQREPAGAKLLTDFAVTSSSLHAEVSEKSPRSLREVSENFVENDNKINDPLKSLKPIAYSQEKKEKSPLPPEGASDDMPKHVKPVSDWSKAFSAEPEHETVRIEAGAVVLVNGTRAEWLARFGGDAEGLDLALIQVAGQIQPNSRSHSIEQQAHRHLAKIVQERRDRDRRYRDVAAQNAAKGNAKPIKRTLSDVLREQAEGVSK